MLYAIDVDGSKILATPGTTALCPACKREVIAKCGEINIWHWAHKRDLCDNWYEPETDWHLNWKSLFPKEWVEVPISKCGEFHIADIKRPDGLVVEFQHSSISPEQIRIREVFYERMIWVFDIRDCAESKLSGSYGGFEIYEARFEIWQKESYWTFCWKYPRKHIAYVMTDYYLDMGLHLFNVKKMHVDKTPFRGWGYQVGKSVFLSRLTSI